MEKTHDEITRKEHTGWKQTAEDDNWRNENALGKLRDYLNELLGEDSSDKEAARQALGIDLTEIARKIEAKADQKDILEALLNKVDQSEMQDKTKELQEEIVKRGTPVGSIEYFAMAIPPAGYLKADGSEAGRETYAALYAAIGTIFGEGDGETTFNLPDLINRFAQGSSTPGQKLEAGLPNITGEISGVRSGKKYRGSGAFSSSVISGISSAAGTDGGQLMIKLNCSDSSSIYGASNTVQPPALTLLPCIKAFDAAANPGLIDITGLANEVDGKLDKVIDSKPVRYVIDACNVERTGTGNGRMGG